METFLVEHYHPGSTAARLRLAAHALRDAAATLAEEGCSIRYLRSTIVPDDEAFLSLLEASSERLIRDAHLRAGLPVERISRAFDADGRPTQLEEES